MKYIAVLLLLALVSCGPDLESADIETYNEGDCLNSNTAFTIENDFSEDETIVINKFVKILKVGKNNYLIKEVDTKYPSIILEQEIAFKIFRYLYPNSKKVNCDIMGLE